MNPDTNKPAASASASASPKPKKCPKERPICLNKPRPTKNTPKTMMTKMCTDLCNNVVIPASKTVYIPNTRLNEFASYLECKSAADTENANCNKIDYVSNASGSDNNENCYSLDTAWLVMMGDLEIKIDTLSETIKNEKENEKNKQKEGDTSTTPPPNEKEIKDAIKKLEELSESTPDAVPINLIDIFGSILEYGKIKWGIPPDWEVGTTLNTNDKKLSPTKYIAKVILNEFKFLIDSPGFTNFSNSLDRPRDLLASKQSELDTLKALNKTGGSDENLPTQDDIFDIFKTIKNLFKITKYFMIEERELINYNETDIEKEFTGVINSLNKLFPDNVIASAATADADNASDNANASDDEQVGGVRSVAINKILVVSTSIGKELLSSAAQKVIAGLAVLAAQSAGLSVLVTIAASIASLIPFFNIVVGVLAIGLLIRGAVNAYISYSNKTTTLEKRILEISNELEKLKLENEKLEKESENLKTPQESMNKKSTKQLEKGSKKTEKNRERIEKLEKEITSIIDKMKISYSNEMIEAIDKLIDEHMPKYKLDVKKLEKKLKKKREEIENQIKKIEEKIGDNKDTSLTKRFKIIKDAIIAVPTTVIGAIDNAKERTIGNKSDNAVTVNDTDNDEAVDTDESLIDNDFDEKITGVSSLIQNSGETDPVINTKLTEMVEQLETANNEINEITVYVEYKKKVEKYKKQREENKEKEKTSKKKSKKNKNIEENETQTETDDSNNYEFPKPPKSIVGQLPPEPPSLTLKDATLDDTEVGGGGRKIIPHKSKKRRRSITRRINKKKYAFNKSKKTRIKKRYIKKHNPTKRYIKYKKPKCTKRYKKVKKN